MFIDFREGKREQGGGRETVVWERNTDWLPPVHALTRDQTHHLGMCSDGEPILQPLVPGMLLQPTGPPGQGPCT